VRLLASRPVQCSFFWAALLHQGTSFAPRAARLLQQQNRPIELKVVGDGPERAALQKLAEEGSSPRQVYFLGRLLDSQIADLLATADLLVVPSLRRRSFGRSLLKYMLRGIPILAPISAPLSKSWEMPGARSKPEIPPTWLVKSFNLLDDPAASQRLGIAAHQRVRDFFVLSRMIEGHAQIYRRLRRTGPRDDSYNDQQCLHDFVGNNVLVRLVRSGAEGCGPGFGARRHGRAIGRDGLRRPRCGDLTQKWFLRPGFPIHVINQPGFRIFLAPRQFRWSPPSSYGDRVSDAVRDRLR